MAEYAEIYVLDATLRIDCAYDYYIPPDLRRDVLCGDFVTVPFGTANIRRIGLVTALKSTPENDNIEHKPIISVCSKTMSLSKEALGLCFFIKEQTLCTIGDAVRAVIPASVLSRLEEIYRPSGEPVAGTELDVSERLVFEYIKKRACVSREALKSKFGPITDTVLKKLTASRLVLKEHELKGGTEKYDEYYSLAISAEHAAEIAEGTRAPKLRSAKQAELLLYFSGLENGEAEASAAISACSASKAQLTALCEKGLLKKEKRTVDRSLIPTSDDCECSEIVLNDEQQAAFDALCRLSDGERAHGALLYGVTGSGKTAVMLRLIDRVLESGRGAIVLLPEIALTPQSLRIFCSRYGQRVAIIHSGLSAGERYDTYRRIRNGGADVVIGTRSAVFAPLERLGLIIIDEEQEHTYKSDMNPKYHTRDVARYRCAYHKGLMLLASATPSFESYKKALDGSYALIELKSRYGGASLPSAIVEDMRSELQTGNISPLGSKLCSRLLQNYKDGNQSILFLNRRGYNNFFSCSSCGEAVKCPQCSVSMTYHTSNKSYDSGYLACHWCGRRLPVPTECPSCGSAHLARIGYGTQRVEQELSELMPSARILRMDTDTTGEKGSYEKLLGSFRRHEADILLGTQMVTKGHDFPDVTLVGVLLADTSLYLDDFRASERTFAMLTQVIGRAGRASKSGVAVIQTNNPDNECIRLACAQDYGAFYESEIKLRKLLVFPPFCDIALLTLTCHDEKELLKAATMLSEKLSEYMRGEYADIPLMVYGPFEAPVYKVDGKYRMRTVIKCRINKRSREMLSALTIHFSSSQRRTLSLSVDINPTNL